MRRTVAVAIVAGFAGALLALCVAADDGIELEPGPRYQISSWMTKGNPAAPPGAYVIDTRTGDIWTVWGNQMIAEKARYRGRLSRKDVPQ